jgi:hypothetical protein
MVHEAVPEVTELNALILYWENTGKRTEQLSYQVQLAEGLFIKYGCVVEHIHLIIQCRDLWKDI